jgi:hypothetical protein
VNPPELLESTCVRPTGRYGEKPTGSPPRLRICRRPALWPEHQRNLTQEPSIVNDTTFEIVFEGGPLSLPPDEAEARKAWERARDLLLIEDLDASVLRFTLGGRSHVALLGELPLPGCAGERMKRVLEEGSEPAVLPAAVEDRLRLRRREFKGLGFDYLERRTELRPAPDNSSTTAKRGFWTDELMVS